MLRVFAASSLALLILGCSTCPEPIQYILPSDLTVPQLLNTDDPIDIERDYVRLVVQDLRWRIRMAAARLVVGEITPEEYAAISNDIQNRITVIYE